MKLKMAEKDVQLCVAHCVCAGGVCVSVPCVCQVSVCVCVCLVSTMADALCGISHWQQVINSTNDTRQVLNDNNNNNNQGYKTVHEIHFNEAALYA